MPLYLFALVCAGDLLAVTLDIRWLEMACKPLAIPLLLIWMLGEKMPKGGFRNKIALALIFSCGGDVALLFQEQMPVLFLIGLGSFLIAHLFYVSAFFSLGKGASLPTSDKWRVAILLLYGVFLYTMLFPQLDAVLKVAVFIYALAITSMAVMALRSRTNLVPEAFSWIMLGAMLFVISDSLLAINKFVRPLPLAGLLIMSTYLAAQYFIVKGSLKTK